MKPRHKNLITQTIIASGIPLEKFNFHSYTPSDLKNPERSVVELLDDKGVATSHYFVFRNSSESYNDFDCLHTTYSPSSKESNYYPEQGWFSIEDACDVLKQWLNEVIKPFLTDGDEPDLWEEYLKSQQLGTEPLAGQPEQFTIEERAQLRLSLNDLRLLIPQQFNLSTPQIDILNNRLEYLIEALERTSNKTDYKSILIGAFLSLLQSLALNPEQAQNLYNLFIKVLHIVHFLPPAQ